jgi:hypothetical protein
MISLMLEGRCGAPSTPSAIVSRGRVGLITFNMLVAATICLRAAKVLRVDASSIAYEQKGVDLGNCDYDFPSWVSF